MSSFTNHTAISPTDHGKRVTTEWFRYYIWEENSNEYVDVPAWFEFDGASVPSILGIFIQKVEPDTIMSACLHDWLYIHKEIENEENRIATDLVFLESLIIYNIPKLLKENRSIKADKKEAKKKEEFVFVEKWVKYWKEVIKNKDIR